MSAAIYGCNTQCYRSGHPRSNFTFQVPQAAHYGPFMRHVQPGWPLGPSPFRKFEAPARGSIVTHARRKWYAIFEPSPVRGVYRVWEQVQQLVSGQSNAVHKGFASEAAALEWISKLSLRAKEEDATLEHLRQVILGPNYRAGLPAALTSDSCLLSSHASSNTGSSFSDAGGSVATDAVNSTVKPVPIPRPWQTPPIVLPVSTTPTREYYRKWYAVRFVDGGTPGVYNTWQEAEAAISGRYAEHRSFDSHAEALAYAFGSSYVGQLLPPPQEQQQQEGQLQPVREEDDIQTAAVPGLCQAAYSGLGFDFAAATQASSSQSEQVDLPVEYDPNNVQSDLQYGIDGDAAGGYDTEYQTAEFPSWMPSSESYGLPTGLRMPVLTAWDAATRRQPLPAQPNSGDDRRISSNNLLPLPAPPAMTMPLLYDAPYASPATPAMVLTAGRGPVRRRHDVPHHHSRSPIVANFERSLRHPLCAASASPSSPLSSSANSDSSPAAAAPSPSSEFAPPVLSAGEAWPSQTAAAASQQTRSGAEDPDLNSPDPDSVRARDGLSGNPQGDAETAVAASTQQEYGSGRATTPVKGRRGRPRKAPVAAISPPPPGGRGAGLIAHVPPTKRPRGRPRKQPLSDACTTVIVEPAAAKRGRGRPLKMVPIQNEPVAVETREEVKRPRGRPRRGGVPLTPAAASATQPKGDRRRVGVGLAAGTPAKAVGTKRVKAAAPLPPSEAVTEAAEGPVKPGRGRPRSPQSRTGANQNTVRTGILTPGGWTPRGPGSLCLEADRPYILAFYWGEPLHSPAPEPQSTASTTSVPASPPLSPHSTSSGANPGRRKSNSATTQPGSLELSYSVILLDGEDYSLVASKAGSIRCHHPAEGAYVLLNLCVQEVVRKCGLRRVQLLGRGLRPTMCPPAATAAAAWAESVCEGRTGEAAEVAVATGVEFDVEWSLLDDEPTLSSAAKMLRPMTIGRLESANESMELMPDGAERDALLLLAARAPELQLTVERLVGEWAPRYDKCTLLSTILHVQSELYSLRREIINSGLSATAAAAAAAAVDDDDDATATRGAPVTAATTKGARGHPHQQENAVGDHPRGEPAAGGGSEMMMLPLRKVLGDMTGCEGSAPARLLVRAFVLRKLYLDLMTWVENPYERRHFLDAAAVAKTS